MAQPLMPMATAVWLIENTTLSFDQIAEFCGLHPLQVQAIADGEVAVGIVGRNPIQAGELSREEIERCEQNPAARLQMATSNVPRAAARTKGPRYTPVAKRQDKPNAIAWLVRNHPELSDTQISRLLGTTKTTIIAIRDRTHWNSANIKPQHPVDLGLCTYTELNSAIAEAQSRVTARDEEGTPEELPGEPAEPAEAAPE